MRRRLVLLSLATTVLVVVAFVLPLGLLVRRQATEAAKVSAERDAQSVAGLVALAVAVGDEPDAVSAVIGDLPEGTAVYLGDTVFGTPSEGQLTLAQQAAGSQSTLAHDVEGGWAIAIPVIGVTQAVVSSFVTSAQMTSGVYTAWLLLGALALGLVALGVWVADRFGRSLTGPIEDLARSAHKLAEGDLEARVEPSDPEEIRATGEAFNYLAGRLDTLLAEEREAIVSQVDRLEHAMNQVIDLARSRATRAPGESEIDRVVSDRAAFWRVLAAEQDREMTLDLSTPGATVAIGNDDLGVVVDTLVGNVFSHTPAGTPFEIRTGLTAGGAPYLEVVDEGPGFEGASPERGVSGGGSTGLGLDIVRKIARAVGGELNTDDRPGGGAVVRVVLG
ncbi:MAG TPA: HAMP domain-containing protein [Acidimicrobiia bacterium]